MPPSVPCPEQPGESSGHGASSGGHRQRGEEGVEEDQENQGCSGDEQGDIQHDLIIMTARRRRQSGIGPGGPSYSRLRGPDSGHALQVFVSTVLVAAAEPQEVQFPEDVVVDEITVDEWVLAATILVVAVVLAALVRRLAVQALSRRDASRGRGPARGAVPQLRGGAGRRGVRLPAERPPWGGSGVEWARSGSLPGRCSWGGVLRAPPEQTGSRRPDRDGTGGGARWAWTSVWQRGQVLERFEQRDVRDRVGLRCEQGVTRVRYGQVQERALHACELPGVCDGVGGRRRDRTACVTGSRAHRVHEGDRDEQSDDQQADRGRSAGS
jgi:hypothetical protein